MRSVLISVIVNKLIVKGFKDFEFRKNVLLFMVVFLGENVERFKMFFLVVRFKVKL